MDLTLRAPTREDVEAVRKWRNDDGVRAGLRTPFLLTEEMQQDFYETIACNRFSPHRYWSFIAAGNREAHGTTIGTSSLAAFGGLTDISWENGHAEISLIVDPRAAGKGIGSEAVKLILREAFNRLRLATVFGEVYHCNPAHGFWTRMMEEARTRVPGTANYVVIPRRKFWDGKLHDATVFWFVAPRL